MEHQLVCSIVQSSAVIMQVTLIMKIPLERASAVPTMEVKYREPLYNYALITVLLVNVGLHV